MEPILSNEHGRKYVSILTFRIDVCLVYNEGYYWPNRACELARHRLLGTPASGQAALQR